MIKPGDIPDDLAVFAASWSDISPRQSRDMTAAILNAAIEYGVVSPPCYAVRDKNGELVSTYTVYTAKMRKEHGDILEHWKGQDE